jgi:Ca-activated chloride channel homolog
MNWLHGGALVFLSLIPVILIFYFMKLRRKEIPVSASFLWKKALQEARVDSFFQRLRMNILLILQILFIVFLSISLARPYMKSFRNLPPKMIFILDGSASMQAREERKSRFDKARDRIVEIIEGARKETSFALIVATKKARLANGFTCDKQEILKTLRGLSAQDTSTLLEPSLQLATSLVKTSKDAQIMLFSDGGGDFTKIWPRYASMIHYEAVGSSTRNLGIVAFDLRETGERGVFQVFVGVRSYSPRRERALLSALLDGDVKEAREISLNADEERSYIFDITSKKAGRLEVSLDIRDDLAVDNHAYAPVPDSSPRKILLISHGNPFLEKLLSLMSFFEVRKISSPDHGKSLKDVELSIWDSMEVKTIPQGNNVFINCTLPREFMATEGVVKMPEHLSWDRNHPINSFLDFSALTIIESPKIKTPPWGHPLLSSEKTDLILLMEKGGHRSVVVGFDPYRSDLFLSPLFPIFMNNVFDYFLQLHSQRERSLFRPEESFEIPDRKQKGPLKLILPSGQARSIEQDPGMGSWSETSKVGFYTFEGDRKSRTYAVSLIDEEESRIAPVTNAPATGKQRVIPAASSPMINEFWRPLAFAALLLLILEWSCFHRRR